eukprot:CAMPEP_0201631234 /NCGR_PEP_ID=MMETSP0493-20130528/5281_1 /ASSEMBLY_ACC=CAM_ASM_000838 /TAXON_ID=420259 /ORGANISM="Thalassiosira gravida, Strain GMp14c1" /LENGTH=458 /DNA_ID=CAMNT_0048102533 /DNA_START=19 /DNA_END=1395 /DNA_ORIENTATION=-
MLFQTRAQQRTFCIRTLLGFLAIFAGSFLLGRFSTAEVDNILGNTNFNGISHTPIADDVALTSSSFLRVQRSRFLGFSRSLLDPKTTAPRTKITVTIYVTKESYHLALRTNDSDDFIFNPALSIFKTDILQRYGTGKVQYIIRERAECNLDCNVGNGAALQQEPCLAVTRHMNKDMKCDIHQLKCNYPQCKTMVTNDEMCARVGDAFDARLYYTSESKPESGYLPLGPRLDAWKSLKEMAHLKSPQFFIMPSSKRKFAFNAVFSQRTNLARQELASAIESNGPTSKLPVYASMTEQELEDEKRYALNTDDYVEVLLDSIFTLSPAGHNPECYRIFEAVESGSIPVFSRGDLYGARHPNPQNRKALGDVAHPCKDALVDWYEAPVVVLDSWDELYPTMERLLEDPEALDEMQDRLRVWYDDYMRGVVSKFEDFMLDSTKSPVATEIERPVDSPPTFKRT